MADAVSDAVSVNPGLELRGRYVLRERIGRGGHGEVWRAQDPRRGGDIALKILRPEAARIERAWSTLRREHELAGLLHHPCVLKVYAPERESDTLLLPMELASGGDLRQMRGMDYLLTMPLLIEVAQALEHAHARGVVHRDLKPGNVLLDAHGRVKVADFGLAGRIAEQPEAGARGWSPFSASPAQLRGEPPMPADDIYGLGALAYELLSRHPPHYPRFQAQRLQREPVPPLVPATPVPRALERLILRMLSKDPAARPGSMREVVDALDRALNDTLTFDFVPPPAEAVHPPLSAVAEPPAATPAAAPAADAPFYDVPPSALYPQEKQPVMKAEDSAFPHAAPTRGALDGDALAREVGAVRTPEVWRLQSRRRSRWRIAAMAAAVVLPVLLVLGALAWPGPEGINELRARLDGRPGVRELASRVQRARASFDRRYTALEAGGAASWDAADLAAARTAAAESAGAMAAGGRVGLGIAQQRIMRASKFLDAVEQAAPTVPSSTEKAQAAADQAYAQATGAGFAALTAGRLDEARVDFQRAQGLRPQGAEAADGLMRVRAASTRNFARVSGQGLALESQERWRAALSLYNTVPDAGVATKFARDGRRRATARLHLDEALQSMLDHPERLAPPAARKRAATVLEQARQQTAAGPVLRAQIAQLTALLGPGKP
ncbi:MAG: serine/threonine protein kinase [Proteobacteria bacterium]|nr:serine/threonine protein kinase [Pseudomonadota bacterium]